MGSWGLFGGQKEKDSSTNESASEVTSIDLGEMLDISFAAKLHSQLKDEVKKDSTVSFVSSELARIDASCLQVLAGFMKYAKENGIKVCWEQPAEALTESARLLGLSQTLELNK